MRGGRYGLYPLHWKWLTLVQIRASDERQSRKCAFLPDLRRERRKETPRTIEHRRKESNVRRLVLGSHGGRDDVLNVCGLKTTKGVICRYVCAFRYFWDKILPIALFSGCIENRDRWRWSRLKNLHRNSTACSCGMLFHVTHRCPYKIFKLWIKE